ncbi:LOW QUALITY PROTEIN: SCO-spondin, partial [Galemys pyrenaicus]
PPAPGQDPVHSQTAQPRPPRQPRLPSGSSPGRALLGRGSRYGAPGGRGAWQQLWAPSVGRRRCEQTESILVEEEVTPRQEDLVPCPSLYHYRRRGWQLDPARSVRAGLCPIYKAGLNTKSSPSSLFWDPGPQKPGLLYGTTQCELAAQAGGAPTAPWPLQTPAPRATVLPHGSASQGKAPLTPLQGACRSAVLGPGDTAGGMAAPGSASAALASNSQAPPLECWASRRACAHSALLSDGLPPPPAHQPGCHQALLTASSSARSPAFSSSAHVPCTQRLTAGLSPPGDTPSPASLQPLAGTVAHLWSQHQHPSATCATWSGFHYRTFGGRHFRFPGRCSYLLAGAADSSWAVHLLSPVYGGRDGSRTLCPCPGLSLQWQGDWLVLSGGLGVVVWLDRSTSVSISVDHELQGQTQGLCGLYSGRPEDDFLEPGGGLVALATTFGDSWRLPDSEAVEMTQSCEDPLRVTEADLEASLLRAEAQDVCHQLLDGPFRECHAQVPPAEYQEACLFAYCAGVSAGSGPESRLEAVCATLAHYAQDCAQRHIPVRWRKLGFCERPCPGGQQYSDCASACPPSCSAVGEVGAGPCGTECVSGCECPPGLFWDGALCVPAARCPCYHRRQRYAPGDTVRQRVCREGRWLCAQAPCPAECAVGGDGHYLTFDGRSFSFRGGAGCSYILVQDFAQGKLLITLEHGACNSGSCLRAMSVFLGDTHIQLRDSGTSTLSLTLTGEPWSDTGGLSAVRASSSFLLLCWPGAQLLWGVSDPAAYITLDPRHAHQVSGWAIPPCEPKLDSPIPTTVAQVQGLCGTFTWNQQDDFLTPAGDVETSIAAFASKFQVAGDGKCSSEDCTSLSPCGTHAQGHVFAEATCAILQHSAFQECHGLVDREPFHLRCLAAVCGCAPGGACLCPVLAAYARRCAQEGALPSWRNQTLCPAPCPVGQEYQECAPACGQHCGEPEDCGELAGCVAGCNCPPGLLWDPEGHVCQERGLWNCTAHRCTPQRAFCPGELVHVPGACLLTCDSPSANLSCPPGSTRGCVCPPGTVLLDERCVPPDLCPCRHGGQRYPPNATIQEDCSHRCCGRCQASGAPHYVTFDGLALTFPGACEYLLVREASGRFTVSAQNMPCGAAGLTCTKALTVRLQGTAMRMLRGRAVTMNGVSVTLPKDYTGSGLSLRHAGLFLLLTTRLGLSLLWDGGTRVLVQLSHQFRGRVAGLCGDFDGDASNDLRSRQGVLEPTAELAAHSWWLPEPGDLPHPCTMSSAGKRGGGASCRNLGGSSGAPVRRAMVLCPQVNAHWAGWTRTRCREMLQPLFARCHAEVPPQQHYEWCVYDACGCDSGGDCECLCSATATYADECARHGVHVRWPGPLPRSPLHTALQCEGGQVYEACGPPCPPPAMTTILSLSGTARPWPVWRAASAPRGLCCTVCRAEWAGGGNAVAGRGAQNHGDQAAISGGTCLEPSSCPCQWEGSFFPAGTVLQDCGNWSGRPRCEEPATDCAEGEVPCQDSGHCVSLGWLCDGQDDCGDGSDEEGCATLRCGEGQMTCSSGHCLPLALLCDGWDDCGDGTDEQGCPCPLDSLACADGRCLPPALLCDGHPDCADEADEESCLGQGNCIPGEVPCADGTCVGAMHLCDGIWDCPDGADEGPGHCPLPSLPTPPAGTWPSPSTGPGETVRTFLASVSSGLNCGPLEFACSGSGECTPRGWRCDGEEDCADGSEEHGCGWPCRLHQTPCAPDCTAWPGRSCVTAWRLPGRMARTRAWMSAGPPRGDTKSGVSLPTSHPVPSSGGRQRDGAWPDSSSAPEGSAQLPPCSRGLFPCGSTPGLCLLPERLCDGAPDCVQGEDEQGCDEDPATPRPTQDGGQEVGALSQPVLSLPSHSEGLPAPGAPNRTGGPCQEYSCPGGLCIGFQPVCDGQPDCESAGEAVSSPEEQGCGVWGPWSPWGSCSWTCGPGVQGRRRLCSPPSLPVLKRCLGPEHQTQACFAAACPVDGEWSPWSPWSPCSESCPGTSTRERRCHPPQNGGRACALLPGGPAGSRQTRPCPWDSCPNTTCPSELDISGQASCPADRPCSGPGCWCPEGQVLGGEGRCVRPRQCPCLLDGAHCWPGQRIKTDDCQLCVCQDGRPRRCRPNPDCAVNCGWSSWSPWSECLGPCGSQSIQWSFRSPNSPRLSGRSRQCRGLHRKARRRSRVGTVSSTARSTVRGRAGEGAPAACASVCTMALCTAPPTARWAAAPREGVCRPGLGRAGQEVGRGSLRHPDPSCAAGLGPGRGTGTALLPLRPAWREADSPSHGRAGPHAGPQCPDRSPLITYTLPPAGDPCYSPLGLARLSEGGLLEHPALTALPGDPTEGPGSHTQQYTRAPYQQLDLLQPRNLTGILVQGAGSLPLLQLSSNGLHWHSCPDLLPAPLPPPQLSPGDGGDVTPTAWVFSQMVQARYVRVWPQDVHQRLALWVELLGCEPAVLPCPGPGPRCASGECAPRGALCDGVDDCEDGSDEEGCAPPSAGTHRVPSTAGTPGLSSWTGQLPPQLREGPVSLVPGSKALRLSPGDSVQTVPTASISRPKAKVLGPGMAAVTVSTVGEARRGCSRCQEGNHWEVSGVVGRTGGIWPVDCRCPQTAAPGPFPPVQCSPGQVPCQVLACVAQEQLCDGTEDCLDGSDERRCGERGPAGLVGSAVRRGALHGARHGPAWAALAGPLLPEPAELRQRGVPGPQAALRPWTASWVPGLAGGAVARASPSSAGSCCSLPCPVAAAHLTSSTASPAFPRSSALRPRALRHSAPLSGLCLDHRILPPTTVAGVWAVWEAWGPCSISCGGGHRSRRRSCVDPPPKNGGAPCSGVSQEGAPCNLQPCAGGRDCGPGLVHVGADLCQKGLVPPCPPSCFDPTANRSCSGHCVEGCRCPPGLLLHGAGCLPLSECPCLVGGELKPPGVPFLLDNCSRLCEEGALLCEPQHCPVPCGWSAWFSWGPCDRSCGFGLRARFRSPSNPPAAFGGAPCEGDRQELQACHMECGAGTGLDALDALVRLLPELPGPWRGSWPAQSLPALPRPWGYVLPRRGHPGGAMQPHCVLSVWGPWAAWSACSAPCNGGIQTRGRSCSGSAPGDPECQGPHSQTRDCNTQACTVPGGMVLRSAEQCHREGGPCRSCAWRRALAWSAQAPVPPAAAAPQASSCTTPAACPATSALPAARAALRPGGRGSAGPLSQLHLRLWGDGVHLRALPSGLWLEPLDPLESMQPQLQCGHSAALPGRHCTPGCLRGHCVPGPKHGGRILQPAALSSGQWGPWSPCSVPCGGGYRNRSRGGGPPGHMDFAACGLQPCAGPVPGVCPGDKWWLDCAWGPASCAELSAPPEANQTYHAGCYCLPGMLLLTAPAPMGGASTPLVAPCFVHVRTVSALPPVVLPDATGIDSVRCAPGRSPPLWLWCPHRLPPQLLVQALRLRRSPASCQGVTVSPGLGLHGLPSTWCCLPSTWCCLPSTQPSPPHFPSAVPPGAGGWGPWGPWSSCSRSCGGGLRSWTRACDQPPPQGLGDYCEGPRAQGEACQTLPCPGTCQGRGGSGGIGQQASGSSSQPICSLLPVTNCSAIEGADTPVCPSGPCFGLTGPSLAVPQHCVWRCQPGCYCPPGQVLSADGAVCVQPAHCGCLDLLSGERHRPGTRLARPDGCNHWYAPGGGGGGGREEAYRAGTREGTATPHARQLVPMSAWMACSQLCRDQMRTRSRVCACPAPQQGGTPCPGGAGEAGPQHQREKCPSAECPGELSQWPVPVPTAGASLASKTWPVFLAQWTVPGAPGARGLPATRVEGSPTAVGRAAGPPPLREAGPALGVTGRAALARTMPPGVQTVRVGRVFSPVGGLVPAPARTCPPGACASLARLAASPAVGVPPGSSPRMASACPQPAAAASTSLQPWVGDKGRDGRCVLSCVGSPPYFPPSGVPENQSRSAGPGLSSWESLEPGEVVTGPCDRWRGPEAASRWGAGGACLLRLLPRPSTCVAGILQCQELPSCPGPGISCVHGRLSCSPGDCSQAAGGFGPWGPWSPCSRSCGGLGTRTRSHQCVRPTPAPGGQGCQGLLQDLKYCLSPDCPGAVGSTVEPVTDHPGSPESWGAWELRENSSGDDPLPPGSWGPWSPCSRSCTDPARPALRSCSRLCLGNCTRGDTSQERPCNLPSCTEAGCPTGMELASCANRCPRRCSDLQEGVMCQEGQTCQRGCRCAAGGLQQLHVPGGAVVLQGWALPTPRPVRLEPLECVWSSWSSWTPCSCQVRVQQRYRHQGPAAGGAGVGPLCTRLDGHFRPCVIGNCSEDGCTPPFEFQACGSPCAGLCATHLSRQLCQDLPPCQPGCYCPQGLLEQAGGCIPPEQCACQHISREGAVTLRPGEQLWLGCKECECQHGKLQCTSRGCADLCQWSPWGPWSPCQVPCGGGFRLRWREAGLPHGGGCQGLWAQTESCNLGPCKGESCEAQGTVPTLDCANQCPRSCVDLWDRVLCLQGPCRPGCHCPPGQLVQDGRCVPIASCRCGLPSPNASWVLAPAEVVQLDCKSWYEPAGGRLGDGGYGGTRRAGQGSGRCWGTEALPTLTWGLSPLHPAVCSTCVNGSLVCTLRDCPALGPWSAWSNCSAPCGGGTTERFRSCERGPEGAPCQAQDTEQQRECNRECPGEHRGAGACLPLSSQAPPQWHPWEPAPPDAPLVLCVLPTECPPGQVLSACATLCPHLCSHLLPGALCRQVPCQRGCGCPGGQLLHNGTCVPPTACPCTQLSLPWGHTLTLEEQARELPSGAVITENCTRWARVTVVWEEWLRMDGGRDLGRHLNRHFCLHSTCQGGAFSCSLDENCQGPCALPPPATPLSLPTEEQPGSCQPFTELRNLTKGLCYLDQVEVTYCRGHCPSSTHVMPEEPYLQSQCQCCSYHLDPESPVRILSLHCPDGRMEPVVLPVIHSCQCSVCQGGCGRAGEKAEPQQGETGPGGRAGPGAGRGQGQGGARGRAGPGAGRGQGQGGARGS